MIYEVEFEKITPSAPAGVTMIERVSAKSSAEARQQVARRRDTKNVLRVRESNRDDTRADTNDSRLDACAAALDEIANRIDAMTRADPPVSEKQRRAMHAAASGNSTLDIPKSVGKEFAEADPGGKLPETKKDAGAVV